MPSEYFLVGDDAYAAGAQMVVPYPGAHTFQDSYDNFNFYQSSTRINIECAFGQLVRRWGILWKKMEGSLAYINKKVMACMILHNIIRESQLNPTGQHGPLHNVNEFVQDDECVPYVNSTDCGGVLAGLPDGAIGKSTSQTDGSVRHHVTGLAEPLVHDQSDCAIERRAPVPRGPTHNRCPHREDLRLHLDGIPHAKRPFSSKKRRLLEERERAQ
jgi:hypothetical protein